MKIHRVLALPAERGLDPGDEYFVKSITDTEWKHYKVANDTVPYFIRGLTDDQADRLEQLTQELIDKLIAIRENGTNVTISETEPEDKTDLWADTVGLAPAPEEQSAVVQALMDAIRELEDRIETWEYAKEWQMDSGDFKNKPGEVQFATNNAIEPGSPEDPTFNPDNPDYNPLNTVFSVPGDERPEDGWPLDVGDGVDPLLETPDYTIKVLKIKGGPWATFDASALQFRELGYITDRNLLYIGGPDGTPKLIGQGSGGGGGTIDGPVPYVDFEDPNDPTTIWRMVIEDGEVKVYDADVDEADDQTVINPGTEQLKGLYISMFYAGGESGSESMDNPCSHNYIELYNYKSTPVNLKGCSIQYSKSGTTWYSKPLKGIIPGQTAYTIRGARCAPKGLNTTMVEIDKFDIEWPEMKLPNTGVKIYLTIGIQPCDVTNPYAMDNTIGKLRDGYIDLAGIGGSSTSQTIDGYETAFPNIITNKRAIHRLYFADYNQRPANTRFGDTNNNKADFTYIEYNKSLWIDNTKAYKPWSVKDGVKSIYFDKNSWHKDKPNMVTNSFGRNAHTTRTFNWISVGYYDEFLQYRKKGTTAWTTVESFKDPASLYKRRTVKGFDGIWFTVHKQIISGLTAGIYEYRVGRDVTATNPTYISDTYEFEMVTLGAEDPFGFVMTADQQAWSWKEYEPWRISAEHIFKWENDQDATYPGTGTKNIGFHLNVGDMTENGIRPHEWLYYYEAGLKLNPNYAQMNVVGNNDLCPNPGELVGKINPESFDWFYTYEHNPANIPMYKGETMKSVYSFDYGNMHFVVVNTNNYIEEQKAWFIKDMQEVHGRATKPRWIVVSMHDACFNIITDVNPRRNTGFNQFADVDETKRYSWSRLFEQWGVHLVLSGHKHTYARSKPVLENVNAQGIVVPLQPIVQTLGTPGVGETQVTEFTGVVYLMSQATGSKLDSNQDVPAQSIVWNAKWFPGEGGSSSGSQKYPTYIKLDFTKDKITHYSYQIKNIMPNTSYSYDPYNPITLPKERILIDTSEVTKKWKNVTV